MCGSEVGWARPQVGEAVRIWGRDHVVGRVWEPHLSRMKSASSLVEMGPCFTL